MKTSIVFWSGTGNTEDFANQIMDLAAGKDVSLFNLNEADADVADAELLLLGCPSMGNEELEEDIFLPWFEATDIKGKSVALFGSYGWGDGEWMRNWEASCIAKGAKVLKTITFNGPDFSTEDVEAFAALI